MSPQPSEETPVLVITPPRGWVGLGLRELWHYRELFGFLVWRDIKVMYKQTALGAAWAILVPLTQMVIFAFIFGEVANLPTDGLPAPVFYYAALLPWTYFAQSVTMGSNSLVGSANLLTKIYFPRLILPASACIMNLVNFAIAFAILALLMAWHGLAPSGSALLLPLLLLMALVTALGASLFLAALNVKYRDVRFAVPFLVQVWMYLSVLLPFSALTPERFGAWRYLCGLNPMAGVIEGFRWCLFRTDEAFAARAEAPWPLIAIGAVSMAAIFALGLVYFRRTERMFADIV